MNNFKLKDLISIKNGKDHKLIKNGNIPIYGSGGIMRYGEKAIYLSESILLPRKGSLYNIQYVNEPFWTVDTIYYTIIDKKIANPFYLFNYLKSLDLSNLNSGTGVPSMTFNSYYNLDIKLPDLSKQQSIAKVLSDLDDKIELNNKINKELESMAKTLYDYWFVQFDFPNEEGKPYKSSGGKMVYNAELKREIPEGWEVKKLFKSCKVQYGFPFSTDFFNNESCGVPVVRIRDILENSISNYSTETNIDAKYIINKGDLLIGMDGNFHINFWSKEGCYLNQRVVKLEETTLPIMYIKYQIEPYISLRERSVSRTTVGHLSDQDLKAINIIIPSKYLQEKTNAFFQTTVEKIIHKQNENLILAELRDWLLPMLMNGQVTVKEVEHH